MSTDRPDALTSRVTGVSVALAGALLLYFARVLETSSTGLQSNWDGWVPVVLPVLALPVVVVWWSRTPTVATKLLPLIAGIALLPGAALSLLPSLADSIPDAIITILVLLGSAVIWSTGGLVVVLAAHLVRVGRRTAAGLAAALLVLASLLIPTVFGAMVTLDLPSWLYAVIGLVSAALLITGGSTMTLPVERAAPAGATTISSALGALGIVGPSLVTYLVTTFGGHQSQLGVTAVIGAVVVLVGIGGAALLGREAVRLVLGAGLLLGCLYGLTSSVGAGLGRDWWLPFVALIVLAVGAGLATLRSAREVGMSAVGILVIVLVSTFLVVENGDLGETLEILLTVAGLVAGAIAGGSIVGATVPRLVRPEDLVPVVLLTLAFGAGVSRLLSWAFEATDTTRNSSLLWICGVLLLAVTAVALWPRPGQEASRADAAAGPDVLVQPAAR